MELSFRKFLRKKLLQNFFMVNFLRIVEKKRQKSKKLDPAKIQSQTSISSYTTGLFCSFSLTEKIIPPLKFCSLLNLPHSRAMVASDTLADNFCLWHCVAVDQRACSARSTQAARELARNFFKPSTAQNNVPIKVAVSH